MRPVELVTATRLTVPLNPFRLLRLIAVELVEPAFTLRLVLEATRLKSTLVTATDVAAENDRDADVPVTVIISLPV